MVVKNLQRGVTVIELLVVIAIFATVSTILIFNYSGFGSNVSLRSLSQEIALAVRKAQTYATSVQGIGSGSLTTTTFPAYGLSFSADPGTVSSNPAPNQKQFIFFADIPSGGTANRLYDNGGSCGSFAVGNECVENFGITTSDKIVQLCTDVSGCMTSGTVNVLFHRPVPDADICTVSGGVCGAKASYLQVVIQSARGGQKTITVWNTGQISAQ